MTDRTERLVSGPAQEFMSQEEFCAYFGIDTDDFRSLVKAGAVLPPIRFSRNRKVYTWKHALYVEIWFAYSPAAETHKERLGKSSRTVPPKTSSVYFVRSGDRVKIGTSHKPKQRIRDLQIANPDGLEVLHTMPGTFAEERQLHKQFAAHRLHGEWFHYSDEIRAYVEGLKAGGQGSEGHESNGEVTGG